jgi:hypothetical protein
MGSAKNRTLEDAEKLAEKLRLLPAVENKKKPLSKQEEVALLKGEIKALQERGYTLDMITQILNSDGLNISTPTLKSYLNKVKEPQRKTTKRQTTRKTEPVVSDKIIKPQTTKDANTGFTIREDSKDI